MRQNFQIPLLCLYFVSNIFRANSNQAVSETVTEVIFAEIALINVPETGVVEKTTDNITIACQATGIPRPNIELRLFTAGGPDLIKTGLFQVLSYRW